MRLRPLAFGLATLFGIRKLGWFIPYRYAVAIADPARRRDYPAIRDIMARHEPAFAGLLAEIDAYAEPLGAIGGAPPPAPRFDQDWFPRLDAAAAYAMVRRHRPARIVEVGSGHSTRFLARAVTDGGLDCAITAIDPAPRAAIGGLPVSVLSETLHDAGPAPFRALAAGDMMVVDSSHVLMPGSDVDLVLNTLLPALPAGVLVHFHDIFLPDDYPADWAWRGYNEQQAVGPLITSGAYELLFASRYVATAMADRLATGILAELPLVAGALESSLWLAKR